jgi:hypothetical protein
MTKVKILMIFDNFLGVCGGNQRSSGLCLIISEVMEKKEVC